MFQSLVISYFKGNLLLSNTEILIERKITFVIANYAELH